MKKLRFIYITFLAVAFISCSDSSPTDTDTDPDTSTPDAEKEFVWDAMNYWYYWQADVPELGDDYFADEEDFNGFLNEFDETEELFLSLLHQEDDFSFFIDDYEEYQEQRDGIYAALGMNYNFFYKYSDGNELVGYVRYVIPDTPADDAGLERLQLFTKVDGTTITVDNYQELLTNDSEHTLTLASIDTSGGSLSYEEGEEVTVASERVVEDPVFETQVIDTSGVNIGYLMYNSFQGNSHQALNDAFGKFNDEGIDELVLDLRYNGGGLLLTSQLLSSMVSGLGSSDKYGELQYNEKRSDRNREEYFLDEVPLENEDGDFERDSQGNFVNSEPMNTVDIPRLYVLTTGGTASASESLINSLSSYIDVTVIGLKTVGKDEGSFTLYDAGAPYLDDEDANSDHKKAIQPIVSKIVNADGEAYPDGFFPDGYDPNANNGNGGCPNDDSDNCVNEITLDNMLNKPALGNPEEPLLARAIAVITGQEQPAKQTQQWETMRPYGIQEIQPKNGIQDLRPNGHGMYLEPFMLPEKE